MQNRGIFGIVSRSVFLLLFCLYSAQAAYYEAGVIFESKGNYTVVVPFDANLTILNSSGLFVDGTAFTTTGNSNILTVGNCTTHGVKSLNFPIKNETGGNTINGTISAHITISSGGYSQTANVTLSGQNQSVCILGYYSAYSVDIQAEYTAAGHGIETWYRDDLAISSAVQTYPLYLTEGTTAVTLTVKDRLDDTVSGAVIRILQYDIGTDSGTETESVLTNNDGQARAQLVLNTQRYKFIVSLNSTILLETAPVTLTGTSYTLRVDTRSNYFEQYDYIRDVACDLVETYPTFTFTFVDPNNQITSGCLSVIRRTPLGDTTINQSCLTAYSGTIGLNGYNYTGSYTILAQGTFILDGQKYYCSEASVKMNNQAEVFGKDGIFFTAFIIIALAMAGLWNPAAAVILATVGLFLSVVMGIFSLSWGAVMVVVIVAGLAVYNLRRGAT